MIASFKVDHLKLQPGLYVSRQDKVENLFVTTFDIRICKPNEEMMQPAAAHTMEHILADFLRNKSEIASDVIYIGPMGCMTGFYLIVKGEKTSKDILPYVKEAFRHCAYALSYPGETAKECGSCYFHNLGEAKRIGKKYLDILESITADRLIYP